MSESAQKIRWFELKKDLALLPEDFSKLSDAVADWLDEKKRPFGICRHCGQNHISAALHEWTPSETIDGKRDFDSGQLGIRYGCEDKSCKGNELVFHVASSYIIENIDRCVWQVLERRGVNTNHIKRWN